ncbi:hypothetical protein PsYK624_077630 [Phanerochaete sordida]|uniref:Uncharacterized protein n=1 Tax=Phanerochaete sordida TaxID=48140 RepID=A0A9P3GB19_9APHY|nr:hypothetical protein PsYK624_077630 [Phanerochaete sordida]
MALIKLFSFLALLCVAHIANAMTMPMTGASICSTKGISVKSALPDAMLKQNFASSFYKQAPVYTALSVGTQNYSCSAAGKWAPTGAITYLYDISCLPVMHHKPFTSFISGLWDAAPPVVTSWDIVKLTEKLSPGVALGIHYWIPDPVNATSGKIYAKWDFSKAERFQKDMHKDHAFVVSSEKNIVPDPHDATVNSPWLEEPVLLVNGKKDGELADSVLRFNSNGGAAPNTTCSPGSQLEVKSTLNFWFYGGHWADTVM